MAPRYPAIPEPTLESTSLRDSILSIKQVLEVLTGQRGNPNYAAVTGDNSSVAQIADKVSKTGDVMSGSLRVNGAIHDWPLIVKAGSNVNVGFVDAGGSGSVIFGNINDAGVTWNPINVASPLIVTNHVTPGGTTGTYNLGSSTQRWATVYTSDLDLNNGIGDWTIVEGDSDLFIYNNKKNKVYKFLLYEVTPETAPPKR